ncbi:MAG: c-type cytochrome [Novosphingobium sp.]
MLLAATLVSTVSACHREAAPAAPYAWAFGSPPARPPETPPADRRYTVPGSSARLTRAQVRDRLVLADWFPGDHPPMPAPVGHARAKAVAACGFCHLPSGDGRPENASIAGLPRDYIMAQVRAFRDGTRRSAVPGHVPTALMAQVARAASDAEVAEAAGYFAALTRHGHTRVIEATTIPAVESGGFVFRPKPDGGTETLGRRIVELPDDFERFELRDPRITYRAFVPPGSMARGAKVAANWGGNGSLACASCHGQDLRGQGLIPPLAGRSASYLARQLANFQRGARNAPADAPMRQVAAHMSEDDVIALAAYLASRSS